MNNSEVARQHLRLTDGIPVIVDQALPMLLLSRSKRGLSMRRAKSDPRRMAVNTTLLGSGKPSLKFLTSTASQSSGSRRGLMFLSLAFAPRTVTSLEAPPKSLTLCGMPGTILSPTSSSRTNSMPTELSRSGLRNITSEASVHRLPKTTSNSCGTRLTRIQVLTVSGILLGEVQEPKAHAHLRPLASTSLLATYQTKISMLL